MAEPRCGPSQSPHRGPSDMDRLRPWSTTLSCLAPANATASKRRRSMRRSNKQIRKLFGCASFSPLEVANRFLSRSFVQLAPAFGHSSGATLRAAPARFCSAPPVSIPACLLRHPLLSSFKGRVTKGRTQRIKRRVRYLFHSRRSFLRRSRPEWRLRVVFQSQRKEPRIILSPQFRGDAKAKINSRRDAAGSDAVSVLHHTVDDKLRPKLRQDVTHRPVRRSFVTTQQASRTKDHGSC